jgi:hypothetical protein
LQFTQENTMEFIGTIGKPVPAFIEPGGHAAAKELRGLIQQHLTLTQEIAALCAARDELAKRICAASPHQPGSVREGYSGPCHINRVQLDAGGSPSEYWWQYTGRKLTKSGLPHATAWASAQSLRCLPNES